MYQHYGASLVALITTDQAGDEHVGSAFHVGDGVFVTARHVVEGQVSCRIELDPYRLLRLGGEGVNDILRKDLSSIEIEAHPHPDAAADVAVFSVPVLADLPAIPLGRLDHRS